VSPSRSESRPRIIAVPQSDIEKGLWRRANNARPKWPYFVLNSPKIEGEQHVCFQVHPLIPSHLAELSGSPEKAGVGGSIPSLATIPTISKYF
jgi:hypothetical protein